MGRKHPVIAERFFARVQIRVKVSFRKALRDHPGFDRDRQTEWTVEEERGESYSNGDVIKVRMRAIACILHKCMATEHSATRPRMIYSSIQVAGISPFIPVYLEKFVGTRCATWPKIGEKFTKQGAKLFFHWHGSSLRERIKASAVNICLFCHHVNYSYIQLLRWIKN